MENSAPFQDGEIPSKKHARSFALDDKELKKSKPDPPNEDRWKVFKKLPEAIDFFFSKADPRDLEGDPTLELSIRTSTKVLDDITKTFLLSQSFFTSNILQRNEGHLLHCCLNFMRLMPTVFFRRQRLIYCTFSVFEALLKYDQRGSQLLFSSLFDENLENISSLIPTCFQTNTSKENFIINIHFPDSRLGGEMDSISSNENIFHVEIKAKHDREKMLFLIHVVKLVHYLLRKYFLWRPPLTWISTLVNVSCCILTLKDSKLARIGVESAGNLLMELGKRDLLLLENHGAQLVYCLSRRISINSAAKKPTTADSMDGFLLPFEWEVNLFKYVAHELSRSSANKSTRCNREVTTHEWLKSTFYNGTDEALVCCAMHSYRQVVSSTSSGHCRPYFQLLSCVVYILRSAWHYWGKEKGSKRLLAIGCKVNIFGYLSDICKSASLHPGRVFPVFRLLADAGDHSLTITRHFLALFPQILRESNFQRFFVMPSNCSAVGNLCSLMFMAFWQRCVGNSTGPLIDLRKGLDILTDAENFKNESLGITRCFLGFLSLVSKTLCIEDWDLYGNALVLFLKNHVIKDKEESIYIMALMDGLVNELAYFYNCKKGAIVLVVQRCIKSILRLKFSVQSDFAFHGGLSLTSALYGFQRFAQRLPYCSSEILYLRSRGHSSSQIKAYLEPVLSVITMYLMFLEEYYALLSETLKSNSSSVLAFEVLHSQFAEVQLRIFSFICALPPTEFDKIVSMHSQWESSLGGSVIYDVEKDFFMQRWNEVHSGLAAVLLSFLLNISLAEVKKSVTGIQSLSMLRRATFAAACFSKDPLSAKQVEELILLHCIEEGDCVTRCGVGAVFLSTLPVRCEKFSLFDKLKVTLSHFFSHSSADEVNKGYRASIFLLHVFSSRLRGQMLLSAQLPVSEQCTTAWEADAKELLRWCLHHAFLSEQGKTDISTLKSISVSSCIARQSAEETLTVLEWNKGDVLRYFPDAFFEAVLLFCSHCPREFMHRDVGLKIRRQVAFFSMDQVVGTAAMVTADHCFQQLKGIFHLEDENFLDPLWFYSAVAKLLLPPASQTAEEKESLLSIIESRNFNGETPGEKRNAIVLFSLLSIYGDIALADEKNRGEEACYSNEPDEGFCQAACRFLSLAEVPLLERKHFENVTIKKEDCAPQKYEGCLCRMLDNVKKVTSSVFWDSKGSLGTVRRRWVLALRCLIKFLGGTVKLLVSNISSLLKLYSSDVHLVPVVASAWARLITTCPKDYLQGQQHVILVEIYSLEQKCLTNDFGTSVLDEAAEYLYENTSEFWGTYLHLLSCYSPMLNKLKRKRSMKYQKNHLALSMILEELPLLLHKCPKDGQVYLIEGLENFLQSLYQERTAEITNEASSHLHFTLLQLAKDSDSDSGEKILSCIGLIGATPLPTRGLFDTSLISIADSARSSTAGHSATDFEFSVWLSWSEMLFTILNRYPRHALAGRSVALHLDAALASQELIREGLKREGSASHSKRPASLKSCSWWSRLDSSSRQLLEAFASSEYILREENQPKFSDDTHSAWLYGLYITISSFTSPRIGNLVKPLARLAKLLPSLLVWLFPYVVLDAFFKTEAAKVISNQFEKYFELRKEPGSRERLLTLLKLFENLTHAYWKLSNAVLQKQNTGDVTIEDCEKLRNNIAHFLKLQTIYSADPSFPSIDREARIVAATSTGNAYTALRCIESGDNFFSLQTLEERVGSDVVRNIFISLRDYEAVKTLCKDSAVVDPKESAIICKSNREWASAVEECELVLQKDQKSIPHQVVLLHCLRQLGRVQLAARYAENLLNNVASGYHNDGLEHIRFDACEAAWRLGDWNFIQKIDEKNASTLLPSLALPIYEWIRVVRGYSSISNLFRRTSEQRKKLIPIFAGCDSDDDASLLHGIALLHGLQDLECSAFAHLFENTENGCRQGKIREKLLDNNFLQNRLKGVSDRLEVKEPLLSLHRIIYEELGLSDFLVDLSEVHIQMLRDKDCLNAALGMAKQCCGNDSIPSAPFYLPTAELLYETGRKSEALSFASFALKSVSEDSIKAKLHLLLTDWRMTESVQMQDEIIYGYEKALSLCQSEQAFYKLGLFYEKLFLSTDISVRTAEGRENFLSCAIPYALGAIENFGGALQRGCDTLLVSLHRMITLWLNNVAKIFAFSPAHPLIEELNQKIITFLLDEKHCIPPSYAISALPQLLSRLQHPDKEVVLIICRIASKLLENFPQPCLWQLLPIACGEPKCTASIVREQILSAANQSPDEKEFQKNVEKIFEYLIQLCDFPPRKFRDIKLSEVPFMKSASVLLEKMNFLLPTLENLTPIVKTDAITTEVFPAKLFFKGFDDRVQLMQSKQQPKRVLIKASDGRLVPFLFKSDDEPQKDIRMMNLTSLVNKFFLHDSDAQRKGLSLRRYAIAALTNRCAMIEMVENLSTFMSLVTSCYVSRGIALDSKRIEGEYQRRKCSKVDFLKLSLLARFPPLFHLWFDKEFPSNESWYRARCLYTDSTALWSMVGHIVGLGDRHGENILVNKFSGEVMHVDFAEMFDSGTLLPVPEVVRFRMTQNVVDGMGVTGSGGRFQAVCGIALRCQMKNANALMSVAETHLYGSSSSFSQASIRFMSRRLEGYLDFFNSKEKKILPTAPVALTVEGQVEKLINHSSAVENLAEMYLWWRPWI